MKNVIVIQISPYPPEPGADYHEQLAHELQEVLKKPVMVLASLNHLDRMKAMNRYGEIEKHNCVIVYRAFWTPRIMECRNLSMILKYIIASLKALAQTILVAKKHMKKIIVHFHYGPTTWPGGFLGEHYPLGMLLARVLGAKVLWTIHAFLIPSQLLEEIKERRLPLLLGLPLIMYYMLITRIAALVCHKVIVLVDYPNAPITSYLSKLLGKNKVVEQVHPQFKPLVKPKRDRARDKVVITCLGYIRREKGYHKLLEWLANLKRRNPALYNRINVVIAGAIDRKKKSDIEYLKYLLNLKHSNKLDNVTFMLRKLNAREFNELLAESTVVWCAYTKKYGPSGILAWARAYSVKAIYPIKSNLWGGWNDGIFASVSNLMRTIYTFTKHVKELIQIYND